jgi:hypothetical protein
MSASDRAAHAFVSTLAREMPTGIGRDPRAWDIAGGPTDDLLDALELYDVEPTADNLIAIRNANARALDAWRRAARACTRAA